MIAHEEAERIARYAYGKLVARLAARCGNVSIAEDALGEALLSALRAWPVTGIPDHPEAWVFTAASRRLIDGARRAQRAAKAQMLVQIMQDERAASADPTWPPDQRLGLLLACAGPAIPAPMRVPLMLQIVLGLSAERIAAAYLIAPGAMAQRLVRAKRALSGAGTVPLSPAPEQMLAQLGPVREALYAGFNDAWFLGDDPRGLRRELANETVWLARVLVQIVPKDAEALGLLALFLFLQSRRAARRDPSGAFVALQEQDCTLWDAPMIEEAESLLRRAHAMQCPGRLQIEAAIQSAHAARRLRGKTDWPAILSLYDALIVLADSGVIRLNRAAALAQVRGAVPALESIEGLEAALRHYQPYWALRADLLVQLGRGEAARAAYARAIALEKDESVIAFLRARAAAAPNAFGPGE